MVNKVNHIKMSKKIISVIVPCYNESLQIANSIKKIQSEIKKFSNYNFDLIFVDDGSNDDTLAKIRDFKKNNSDDINFKIIRLSKNYGYHIAVSAGIEEVKPGNAAIICPADDYYLFNQIENMIVKFEEENLDVVWSIRKKQKDNNISNFLRAIFYKIFIIFSGFKNYPKNGTSAFFMISPKLIKNFLKFKESERVVNILIYTMGFKQGYIEYFQEKDIRPSNYSFLKKIRLAINYIITYSYVPLRIISAFGFFISFISLVIIIFIIGEYFVKDTVVEGWASIMTLILFLGGVQLLTIGILGEYIWRIFIETKKRPVYLIEEVDD